MWIIFTANLKTILSAISVFYLLLKNHWENGITIWFKILMSYVGFTVKCIIIVN